jgi:lactate permease
VPALSGLSWALAVFPLVLMLILVGTGRFKTHSAGAIVLIVAVLIAFVRFGADTDVLAVSMGKGLWLGIWISGVVAPALLLYRVSTVGGLDRIGTLLYSMTDRPLEHLLLLAWLAPSLIQGVAGFGTPIALTAPLLVGMGYSTVKAVAYPLIGYCWSVTFGSMASSFYMATVTAQLSTDESFILALRSAVMLAVLALLCASLLCLLEGGVHGLVRTAPFLLATALPLGAVLVGVAAVVPSMATTSAAATGLACAALVVFARRRRGSIDFVKTGERGRLIVLAPYAILFALAFPAFLIPQSAQWIRNHLVLAFDFPGTMTTTGWVNQPRSDYTPLAVLSHPGAYILTASFLGYLLYRRCGLAERGGLWPLLRDWGRAVPLAILPVITLTVLATVLTDAGMTTLVAAGLVSTLGVWYPLVAPLVGASGSFVTGSTTSSNALLSGLQADAADLLGLQREVLLSAQTVGGNVGNSVAPVIVAVGTSTVGAARSTREILLLTLPSAGVLLAATTLMVASWGGIT